MMTAERGSLLDALREADQRPDEAWMASLTERKLEELRFHDEYRDDANDVLHSDHAEHYGNEKYYATARGSQNYLKEWVARNAPGKVVLDYACGDGQFTMEVAKAGAQLAIGLDISRVSVEKCRRNAAQLGLSENTFFVQGDCENTGLPDESVDLVLCAGMLHHLDLSYAFPELRRILKPGGKAFAMEALDYNPAIKLYRKLTPKMRTAWEQEHILSLADLHFARRFFDVEEVRFWHLCSILATPFRKTPLFEPALKTAEAVDSLLLRVPPLNLLAWTFTFVLVKRGEA